MRFAIYSRKSRFTGKGESIENQIGMCKEYISVHYPNEEHNISVFEDEGFSGKNFNRPQFQEMMRIECNNPFDFIVVYRLDRISRNVGDFATLIDKLNGYKTSFICIKEQFDTSTPMGRAMMNIAAVFAQLERETIAERVKDNMYLLAKDGRWLGGTTPLGYRSQKVKVDDDKKICYRLIEDEDELETVQLIFDKYLELRALTKLTTYLINHDIKTRNNCNFAVSSLRRILINPVYCVADEKSYEYFSNCNRELCFTKEDCNGEAAFIAYHKTGGTERVLLDSEEWIIAVGRHKGIIQSEQWIQVQNILDENADKKKKFSQSHNPVALLSGILVCKCGNYMRPKYYRENKKGEKPFAYMCELKEHSKKKKCDCHNLNGFAADKTICDILLNYDIKDNIFNKYIESIKTHNIHNDIETKLLRIKKAKSARNKQIQNYIETIGRGGVSDTTLQFINSEIEKINKSLLDLQAEEDKLIISMNDSAQMEKQLKILETTLKYFKDNYDKLSVEHKRNFIRKCIRQVVWDGENLNIFIRDR